MARFDGARRWLTLGGRVVPAVSILILLTLVLSIVSAVGTRHGLPLHDYLALTPERVLHGEIWRVITWAFIDVGPISLLFTCFTLFWLGNDLAELWSNARLLKVYFGIAAAAGVVTTLVALVDRDVMSASYLEAWWAVIAFTVAWGLYFPARQISLFVITLSGLTVAWLTVAIVVVITLYAGLAAYAPLFFAVAITLAWIFRGFVARRLRDARDERRRSEHLRKAEERRAATVAEVENLDALDDDPPPMPPEIEDVLGRITSEVAAERRKKKD